MSMHRVNDTAHWSEGRTIDVERLGECTACRRMVGGEFYQWKIRHGFTEVVGDYADDNATAFALAVSELKKKFKLILN